MYLKNTSNGILLILYMYYMLLYRIEKCIVLSYTFIKLNYSKKQPASSTFSHRRGAAQLSTNQQQPSLCTDTTCHKNLQSMQCFDCIQKVGATCLPKVGKLSNQTPKSCRRISLSSFLVKTIQRLIMMEKLFKKEHQCSKNISCLLDEKKNVRRLPV